MLTTVAPFREMKFISETGRSFHEMEIHFVKLTMRACGMVHHA